MYQTALNIQANVESSQTDRHTPSNNVNNDSSLSSISPNSCSSNSSRNSPAIPVQNQSTPMVYSSQQPAQYHQYYPQPTNYYQQYSNYYYNQYNYDYSRYQQQQQVQKLMNDSASFNKGDKKLISEVMEDHRALNPYTTVSQKDSRDKIKEGIMTLPEKQRLVLSLYYYEDLNLKEIGQVLDVTESRVSQLHTQAILKLRSKLRTIFESVEDLAS